MHLVKMKGAGALRRDEKAVSAVEFALVAPVFALMVLGISDFAMGFSARLSLEQAAHRTLEKVAVGQVRTDYQHLKAEAAVAAGVPQENVTVDNWLECDQVRQPDFNGFCPAGQMISRYVQIDIDWEYVPSFRYGPLAEAVGQGENGAVPIAASAAMRVQ